MKKLKPHLAILAATIVVAACGGGGDDAAPTVAATSSAEGFWSGTSSNGWTVNLAILENGQTWGVYSSGGTIYGALHGTAQTSGSSVSGSGTDYYVPTRSTSAGSFTGTYTAKSSLNVTLSTGVTFAGTYGAGYDQAPSLASVAGTFNGTGVTGYSSVQSVPVSISASGGITVPAANGCAASGQLTPRASGKNIFDVSVTFNGSNCALGNGATTTGVAYYDSTARRLLALALNGAKSDGFIYIGSK